MMVNWVDRGFAKVNDLENIVEVKDQPDVI